MKEKQKTPAAGDYQKLRFLPVPAKITTRNKTRKTLNSYYLSRMSELSMGDALRLFLQKSRLRGNIQALQISDVWEQLMGKTIARYTDKIQIIHRTLFITTSVAPLKNELFFQKEKIIQRVNEALGEPLITEVVIN